MKFLLTLPLGAILHDAAKVVSTRVSELPVGSCVSGAGVICSQTKELGGAQFLGRSSAHEAIDPTTFETPEAMEVVLSRSFVDQLLYEEAQYRVDAFRSCMGRLFDDALHALKQAQSLLVQECDETLQQPCFHNDKGKFQLFCFPCKGSSCHACWDYRLLGCLFTSIPRQPS